MGARLVADLTERDRLVGWVEVNGKTIDLLGSKAEGTWEIYGGPSDEYRAEGRSTVRAALVDFARACGSEHGHLEIGYEYLGEGSRYHTF